MNRIVYFLALTITLNACSTTKYSIKKSDVQDIGICYYYNPQVPKDIQDVYRHKLNSFINEYNTEKHVLKISACVDSSMNSLVIIHESTDLVTKKAIIESAVLTTFGIAVFTVMVINMHFAVGYIQFPGDRSRIKINLTDDIVNYRSIKDFKVFNIDYSLNRTKNIDKHWRAIAKKLRCELKVIEREIRIKKHM